LNRSVSQLARRILSRTHRVARFGLLLLVFGPSLVLARSGAELSKDPDLVGQGDPAVVTSLREYDRSLHRSESKDSDESDTPPAWLPGARAVPASPAFGAFVPFTASRERLPDPCPFLHARLRAPPIA